MNLLAMPPKKKPKQGGGGGGGGLLDFKSKGFVIKRTPVYEQYLRSEILLTDSIYSGRIPENAKGKYFKYTVKSYEAKEDTFTVKYEKQRMAVKPGCFAILRDQNLSPKQQLSECVTPETA